MTFLRVGGPEPRGEWEEHLVAMSGQTMAGLWCVLSVGMVSDMVFPRARDMVAAVVGGQKDGWCWRNAWIKNLTV